MAQAQTIDTGILGSVTDTSGAIVVGADITMTQAATGFERKIKTSSAGSFEVRYLLPGTYTVEVSSEGFRTERRTGILLETGQQARISFVLEVGGVVEVVEVRGEAPLMQTENAALGDVVSPERILNLPLNGRRFIDLAALTSGVTVRTSSRFSIIKANGTRDTTMQLSFDGVSVVGNRWNFVGMFPSLDAIQEFKVQTGNYTAEYGGNAGANVNVQFRSGTNEFHGSLYEFLRNDKVDARNYFAPAPAGKNVLKQNQYGAVISGPIVKGKAFFMAGWESQRVNRASAGTARVFTPAERVGDFSAQSEQVTDPFDGGAPFPNNVLPSNRVSAVSAELIKLHPAPNLTGQGSQNLSTTSLNRDKWDQALTRLDHHISDKDQVSFHYIIHDFDRDSLRSIPFFSTVENYLNQNVGVQYVRTFSATLLNEVRFGYYRGFNRSANPRAGTDFKASDIGINGLKQGGPDGRELTPVEAGYPTISIDGYQGLGDGGGGYDVSRTFQFVENLSIFRGNHSLKAGVDIRRLVSDANTINWPYGSIAFTRDIASSAPGSFMLGLPREVLTPEGQPVSAVRQWHDAFYFQDDWKVRPRLTLNLGIRYDLIGLPHEINGNSRTLRFDLGSNGQPVLWPEDNRTSAEGQGQVVDLWENEHWHIAPRFGLAYRMTDATVIRAGYGIFTAHNQFDHVNILQLNPPMAGSVTVVNPVLNPVATIENPVPPELFPKDFIFNIVTIEPGRKHFNPYMQNWNFQVAQQLTANDVLEVGYVGTKGTFLDTSQLNFNSPDPGPGDIQSRRPYQGFNRFRMETTDGNSIYHALQARFEHRFSNGLSLTSSYNWAHMIDDQQDETNGDRSRAQNARMRGEAERGNSMLDIRHRLVTGYVWELPFGSTLNGAPRALLGGWSLSGIITLQSGQPIRIYQSGDSQNNDSQNSNRPNIVQGQEGVLSDKDPARWFNTDAYSRSILAYGNLPRNPKGIVGPGVQTFDLTMSKEFRMPWEGHQLQFRMEFFNAFNTPNFGNPGPALGNSSFGRVTGTKGDNRDIQFGLKYMF